MDKLYIIAGVFIATLIIFIGGIWLGGYMKVNEYDKTARTNQAKQQEALLKLEKQNTKREADYDKQIEDLKKANDPTNWRSQRVPKYVTDKLQPTSRGPDRSQTYGGLRSPHIEEQS